MVNPCATRSARLQLSAFVTLELVVALGLLSAVMLPVAFAFAQEQRLARAYYFHAVAMEIVDGEMEALTAGESRAFPNGRHVYTVHAQAATNLPAGQFELTVSNSWLRLEWRPRKPGQAKRVVREAQTPPSSSPAI